jgi:hypothetical protein
VELRQAHSGFLRAENRHFAIPARQRPEAARRIAAIGVENRG